MKRSSGNVVLACLLLGITLAVPALAHQEPYSWLDLHVSASGVEGSMTAHMVDLSHEAGIAVPESLLDSRFLASHRAVLVRAMEPRPGPGAEGRRADRDGDLPVLYSGVQADLGLAGRGR